MVLHIRVEARFGRGTGTEEVGVYGGEVAIGIDDDEGEKAVEDDPRICV